MFPSFAIGLESIEPFISLANSSQIENETELVASKTLTAMGEEKSSLTRGKTVADWLGVTKKIPNCHVMLEANSNSFFSLLKKELKKLN